MADKKITDLTAATTTVSTDLLYLGRSPFGVTDDRKITLATFLNQLTSAPIPTTNDGVALGDSTHGFADLFLATGGVVNWANGNATLTHSSGLLTSSVPLAFGAGVAATNGNYQIFRDNSGTNQMVLNVPSGSGINLGVNGTWEFSLSATSADFKANTLDACGNISSNNNATTWTFGIPVITPDAGAHTINFQVGGSTGISLAATGNGAGGVGVKTVSVGTTAEANVIHIGSATALVDITDAHWSITEPGVLSIVSMGANWTNAGRTVADAGILTTVDINGGTIDGTTIGGSSRAAGSFTNITQAGTYTNGADAPTPVTPGFYVSRTVLTISATNYNQYMIVTDSTTGDGTTVSAAGVYLAFVDGVKNYDWFVMTVGATPTDPMWANAKITVLANDAVLTDAASALAWAEQHSKIGAGNVTINSEFLSAPGHNVGAAGATTDYTWSLPGVGSYSVGSDPIPGYLEYRSGFTGGTAAGIVKIYADTVGTVAYEFNPSGGGGASILFGVQGLFYDDIPLYFGGGVSGSPMGKIMYSVAETGFPAMLIQFEKPDDDVDGAALILSAQNGGDVSSGTTGRNGGLVAIFSNDGTDAKVSSNANGGNGGPLYLWPGVGGLKDGVGANGTNENIYACWNIGAQPSPTAQGQFVVGAADTTGLRSTILGSFKVAGDSYVMGRRLGTQGVDVASASTITLGQGNAFELTGTTSVTLITNTGWSEGSIVTLIANENVTITHGTATSGAGVTIKLAGSADFSMTANDTLTLMLCSTTAGAQAWREIARTAI